MFNKLLEKIVLRVLGSEESLPLIEDAVRLVLEDTESGTRRGLARIVRGEAKDAVQDAQERSRALAELDAGYQQWAQERRQALLEAELREKKAAAPGAPAVLPELPAELLKLYAVGRYAKVRTDALFTGQRGVIRGSSLLNGFHVVELQLEGHREPLPFAPDALTLLDEMESTTVLEPVAS